MSVGILYKNAHKLVISNKRLYCSFIKNYRVIPAQEKIDAHGLEIPNKHSLGLDTTDVGEKIFEDEPKRLTTYEESTTEWAAVQDLISTGTVPSMPTRHTEYPTASGWSPPTEAAASHPYQISRTRFHNLPIYVEVRDGGSRKLTTVNKVRGDIWAMENDIREYLSKKTKSEIYTQVDEVTCKLRIRGVYQRELADFAIEKGF